MEKTSAGEVLRALAKGGAGRSEAARLRDVFDEVEAALASGVSRAAILDALHSEGFTMTINTLNSTLTRIRKARAKGTTSSGRSTAPDAAIRTPLSGGEKAAPGPASSPASAPAPPAEPAPEGDAQSHEVLRQDASMDPKQRREAIAKQFIPDDSTKQRGRYLKPSKE